MLKDQEQLGDEALDPEINIFRRDFAAEKAAGLDKPTMDELQAFYAARIAPTDLPY